jgi:hypothetical protein
MMNWVQRQFFALYENDLPASLAINGEKYRHVKTFKYDFFAGTGIYETEKEPRQQVVVKIYRYRRFFGLPMRWLGRISVRHESRLYQLLQGIDGIPKFVARIGETGFAHEFVPGEPLKRGMAVPDDFFDNFDRLLSEVHNRKAAYVDMNKPENVLLGENGRPWLLDFQISFAPGNLWPIFRQLAMPVLKQLQHEDWYHYFKHKRHLRPDQLSPEDYIRSYRRSLPIRIHRVISKPYFAVRHFVMDLLNLKSVE